MLTPHSLLDDRGCRRRRAVGAHEGTAEHVQRARDVGFVRRVLTSVELSGRTFFALVHASFSFGRVALP
jgi:hypothetical protein